MARTFSSPARVSLNAQETGEVWLALLTIDHADLAQPIRLVCNTEDVVSRGQTFVALPFELELPGQDAESPGESRISVDNVDRAIVDAVRGISGPAEVTIEVVLASSPDTVELEIPAMTMRNVDWDQLTVKGVLRFEELMAEPVSVQMTPQRFPGLF